MRIIVDAFGGDNAPDAILLGCVQASQAHGIEIILSGDAEKIHLAARKLNLTAEIAHMEILDCPDVLTMDDDPGSIIKEKKNSSMAVGLTALAAGKGDAFASAGNSGALVFGTTMIVKRIKGVKRVTFAPVMPNRDGFFMLSDVGANVDCRPVMLQQFAWMASAYMNKVMGIERPRVGLVNVGEESHKGDLLRQETYTLLEKDEKICFIGNIEGRDIPDSGADVVITDGFTGNVILKTFEGVAVVLMDKIKQVFQKNAKNKLAGAMVLSDMRALKKTIDYHEVGGAPIMGALKPVFKIHGSAEAKTVQSALRLTANYASSGIIEQITQFVQSGKDNDDD